MIHQDGQRSRTSPWPSPQRGEGIEQAARDMVKALKTVVQEGGTGTKAHLENYTVAGKTGTAQKVGKDPITGKSVYVRKYFASFIGFFPADYPELCISVVMDDPKNGYYGGQTAGPTFQNIAEKSARYLNIRPDIEPEPAVDALASANRAGRGRN